MATKTKKIGSPNPNLQVKIQEKNLVPIEETISQSQNQKNNMKKERWHFLFTESAIYYCSHRL